MVPYKDYEAKSKLEEFLENLLFKKENFVCYVCVKNGDDRVKIYGRQQVKGSRSIHDACCMVEGARVLYGLGSVFVIIAEDGFDISKNIAEGFSQIIAKNVDQDGNIIYHP